MTKETSSPLRVGNNFDGLVKFIPISGAPNPITPSYATELSSGMDLHACIKRNVTIYPNQRAIFETGFTCKIHPDYEGQVRSRGGLAANNGIFVLNSPGTVDADYEGPIKVILQNLSPDPFVVHPGDRIAQFIICPVAREAAYQKAEPIVRGTGHFGSTGVQ